MYKIVLDELDNLYYIEKESYVINSDYETEFPERLDCTEEDLRKALLLGCAEEDKKEIEDIIVGTVGMSWNTADYLMEKFQC